jgi:uncharacterized delta-60 repeat protein
MMMVGNSWADPPDYCLGCMDPSFGVEGQVLIPFDLGEDWNDRANAIARIPGTGKLAIAGQVAVTSTTGEFDFGIAMLNADGSPDPTFGNLSGHSGLTSYGFGSYGILRNDAAWDIVPILKGNPPEWRLFVVGQTLDIDNSNMDMALMYLEPDGTLDISATHQGRYTVSWPLADRLTAAASFADQHSAVAAGTSETATGTDWVFFQVDDNFNVDLSTLDSIPFDSVSQLEDVATTYDGKIVAVGTLESHGDTMMVIARLDRFGSLDIDFGTDGLVYIDPDFNGAADDRAMGVAVDDEGRVVVIGTMGSDDGPMMFLTRLTEFGQVDTTFGVNGYFWMLRTACQATEGRKVVIDPVGNIVTAYETTCDGNHDFGVMRLDPNGQYIDQGWVALLPFDQIVGGDDRPTDLLVQPDGRVVLAGRVQSVVNDIDFGVERVYTEIIFADGFESRGWWGADWEWSP